MGLGLGREVDVQESVKSPMERSAGPLYSFILLYLLSTFF